MMKNIIICLFFVFVSCNFSHKQETGSVNSKSDFSKVVKDTLISYDIEGISAEGAGAKANYVNGKITKSGINIYGETGQAAIIYEFETDKIKVLETKYSYKSGIENVKSDEDMQLDYEINYFIDYNGNVVGKSIPERIDIFQEFKKTVPFELINTFVPDTSVNGKLLLNDARSLQKFYPNGNTLKLVEFARESPIIAFCNTSKSEYLFAYQYEGNTQNEFSCFEIGYYDEKTKSCAQSNYKGFATESGLHLGLTWKEVENIKGKNYTKQGNKITYLINNDPNSVFLRNYNMPEYFLECVFQQNKVVKIKFGFAYP